MTEGKQQKTKRISEKKEKHVELFGKLGKLKSSMKQEIAKT